MAKKKGDEKVNQTPQSDNEEQNFDEEPDFDDPEGFVDDIPDEELLADLLEQKPTESDGYENVIVVDGCPQVGPERLEKLQSVITKIFSKFGTIVNEYYPTTENGSTTGYIFLEYSNPQNAAEAVAATNNWVWYNVASYASDGRPIYDCATMDFQEDNLGYTMRETYVDIDQGNRTQKSYFARVDPTFDAGTKAQFIVSHEDGDKVLQFPFFILSTDYDGFAIAYTCKTLKKKQRTHYVFTWVLSRNKEKLHGNTLKNVEDALSKYTELAEHRQSFVLKDFSDTSCAFTNKMGTDFFTSNFW